MFDQPGFMAYHPPQNVVVSDLMESYTRYYIGATNGDVNQLMLNEFPETSTKSNQDLSVTYSGNDLANANENQYTITLQNGATTIPESHRDANITVLGKKCCTITSSLQSSSHHQSHTNH